jgi:hypothetical protein
VLSAASSPTRIDPSVGLRFVSITEPAELRQFLRDVILFDWEKGGNSASPPSESSPLSSTPASRPRDRQNNNELRPCSGLGAIVVIPGALFADSPHSRRTVDQWAGA